MISLFLLILWQVNAAEKIASFKYKKLDSISSVYGNDMAYFPGWDCFDPYGLSGFDQKDLRTVMRAPLSGRNGRVTGCLDVSEINEIQSAHAITFPVDFGGKSTKDSMRDIVIFGSTGGFMRNGKEICFNMVCNSGYCQDDERSYGYAHCLDADSGTGKWVVGDYFGYVSFVDPKKMHQSSSARALPRPLDTLSKEYHVDSCSGDDVLFECSYKEHYQYSLTPLDAAKGRRIPKVVFEISDGRKIKIKQVYYNLYLSPKPWSRSSRTITVYPLDGGGVYRWQDLQEERVVIEGEIGVKVEKRLLSENEKRTMPENEKQWFLAPYDRAWIWRLLSPVQIDNSLCFAYGVTMDFINSSSETICIDKGQRSVERNFRNITIKITKF